MKLNLLLSIIAGFFAVSSAWADGTNVSVEVTAKEEIYACNAGREFSSADDNNPGTVAVSAIGSGVGYGGRALTKSSSMLAPISTSWSNKISQLNFGISLENYGASYAVYFCYIGPPPAKKIDPKTGKVDPKSKDTTAGIYNAAMAVSASLREYADKAKLTYSIDLSCEFRTASSGAGKDGESAPVDKPDTTGFFGSWGPYYFSSYRQISTQLNSNAKKVPTRCMFKVTLTERQTGIRPNTIPPSEFSVDLDVYKFSDDESLTEPAP